MSKLKNNEIDYIIDTYKKVKSIAKTVEITGFCKNTVNNYVMDISKHNTKSKNCKNKVLKLDKNTGEVLSEYDKPSIAARENKIHPACICRCLKGDLKTAGGYKWLYKSTYKHT